MLPEGVSWASMKVGLLPCLRLERAAEDEQKDDDDDWCCTVSVEAVV